MSGRVLVLNASYEPINVCTMRRATVLVLKSRAEVIEEGAGALHSERLVLARPCVIRLVRYVRVPRDVHRRKITRKAVLARDAWTCQYCGRQGHTGLTVDHVIPRSRGGESVWENIVTSCGPCNRKKGNRLPREVAMHLRSRPRPPGPTVFIRIASPRVPDAWEPYLLAA
jgi:5-methylcytosine-specific restriction endonuclease McrA